VGEFLPCSLPKRVRAHTTSSGGTLREAMDWGIQGMQGRHGLFYSTVRVGSEGGAALEEEEELYLRIVGEGCGARYQ
jgi:hypothetical protein